MPYFPGPLCHLRPTPDINDGTLCRQPSPKQGPLDGMSLHPAVGSPGVLLRSIAFDDAEFEHIKKMGVVKSGSQPFRTKADYLSYRDRHFGSAAAYYEFAAQSDAELATAANGSKSSLKSRLPKDVQKWPLQRQQIWYRWLRIAFKLELGAGCDVPERIFKGPTEDLISKLQQLESVLKGHKAQTPLVPRPKKNASGQYRLGTLSEHALGLAIDIDPDNNPMFSHRQWNIIERVAQKHVVRSKARWRSDPERLWKDMNEINDLFVKNVPAEILKIRAKISQTEALKLGEQHTPHIPSDFSQLQKNIDWIMPPLRKAGLIPEHELFGEDWEKLTKYSKKPGFINLPLDLILELHNCEFKWGATFDGSVDIMHFELSEDE